MKVIKLVLLSFFSFAIPIAFFYQGVVIHQQQQTLADTSFVRLRDSVTHVVWHLKDSLNMRSLDTIAKLLKEQNKALIGQLNKKPIVIQLKPTPPPANDRKPGDEHAKGQAEIRDSLNQQKNRWEEIIRQTRELAFDWRVNRDTSDAVSPFNQIGNQLDSLADAVRRVANNQGLNNTENIAGEIRKFRTRFDIFPLTAKSNTLSFRLSSPEIDLLRRTYTILTTIEREINR